MEIMVSEVCKIASVKHEYSILNWNTAIPYYLFWILKKSVKFVPLKSASIYFVHGLFNPYPTAFPYGNGMVLHFYQQQESSMTKTVHKVINKGLKTYV